MKNNDKNIRTDSHCANRKDIKSCGVCKKSINNCNRKKVVKESLLDDMLEDENEALKSLQEGGKVITA